MKSVQKGGVNEQRNVRNTRMNRDSVFSLSGVFKIVNSAKLGVSMATNKQMKTEFALFGEVWTLFKKYFDIRQSEDARWDVLLEESAAISQKYKNSPLSRDLLMAVMNELERRSKIVNK